MARSSWAAKWACCHVISFPAGVYFELNGQKYPNNSVVTISAIGENDNALVCKTDKTECCGTLPNRFGQFYYPNTAQVPINRAGDGFYRNRGSQMIRLNRRPGTVGPTGLYSCEIPDSSGTNRKIFVNLTTSQAWWTNTSIKLLL